MLRTIWFPSSLPLTHPTLSLSLSLSLRPLLLQVLLPGLLREASGESGAVQATELAHTTTHNTVDV